MARAHGPRGHRRDLANPIPLIWWPAVATKAPGEDHSVHFRIMWSACRQASLEGCAGSLPVSGMLPFEQGGPVATPEETSKRSPVMDADLQDW